MDKTMVTALLLVVLTICIIVIAFWRILKRNEGYLREYNPSLVSDSVINFWSSAAIVIWIILAFIFIYYALNP